MGWKKMLVAIDGSESGYHALLESFKLATDHKSWITVASVVPPYKGDLEFVSVGNAKEAMRHPYVEALEKAKKLAEENRALIKAVLEEGDVHDEILDLADAENCELIVMGRKGKNKFERTLVGSSTARVIGFSHQDVLVIPSNATVGWKRILVAVDGSKYSDNAVDRAIDFASAYEGEVKVLSVVDVPSEFYAEAPDAVEKMIEKARGHVDRAIEKAGAANVPAEGFVREGAAHEVILEMASKLDINTIVIASHGKTGLKRMLMGSVTEQVVGFAHCPVLVTKL
jgi:nucleotide-binding universal stress UspA family protein